MSYGWKRKSFNGVISTIQEYLGLFQFEKQVRAKAGKQRVTYFSDLTLAEPDASKPG